ncbi:DUF397 domain-containing protein [Streptomyces sp. NA04227]|uniref:DUF397 domain-containing protein n=1 Tax=Streptomyces sp. NA04227 TaxID=2742136 RepID=UPI001592520C|nr:DUF397 domain-containing protein [Streptomyces sp. NA04227]QKW06868.1 DUF397 domain-containing protein [Streptomyces sp. NA04227]
MNTVDLENAMWFKSSHSNGTHDCVEVAVLGNAVATRDSKLHGTGPVLMAGSGAWQAFISGAAAGTLDAS